jgi:DnaA family protein
VTTPQLPLGFRFPAHQRLDAFVAGANGAALAAVSDAARDAAAPWAFLSGPEGSGKTHLLIAACQEQARARTQYLPLAALGEQAEAALMATEEFDLLAIDDVHVLGGNRAAEIALFDVFNRGRARGATLLFSARHPPGRLSLVLPDLASRLSSCSRFVLSPLDDAARREVLRARAAARGFELDDAVLEFLFRRYPRDLGALLALLDRVDSASLAAQRRVTVPFLRRIIGLPKPPGRDSSGQEPGR